RAYERPAARAVLAGRAGRADLGRDERDPAAHHLALHASRAGCVRWLRPARLGTGSVPRPQQAYSRSRLTDRRRTLLTWPPVTRSTRHSPNSRTTTACE